MKQIRAPEDRKKRNLTQISRLLTSSCVNADVSALTRHNTRLGHASKDDISIGPLLEAWQLLEPLHQLADVSHCVGHCVGRQRREDERAC